VGVVVLGAAVVTAGVSLASYLFSEKPEKEKVPLTIQEENQDHLQKLNTFLKLIEEELIEKERNPTYELPQELNQNLNKIIDRLDQLDRSDERVHTLITYALRLRDNLNSVSDLYPSNPVQFREEIPISFICPISQELMRNPVIVTESGQTYEKSSIETWLKNKNTDPLTNIQLKSKNIIPNYALKGAIDEWRTSKTNTPKTNTSNFDSK